MNTSATPKITVASARSNKNPCPETNAKKKLMAPNNARKSPRRIATVPKALRAFIGPNLLVAIVSRQVKAFG
jgi:hypothetical protein